MKRLTAFRAKIPKLTRVFRIIELISLACNVIISIAAFSYFAHKPHYVPIPLTPSSSDAAAADGGGGGGYKLREEGKTSCGANAYGFSDMDSAESAGGLLNSLNMALLVTCIVLISMNALALLARMIRSHELNRLRVLIALSLILNLLQLPLFFAILTFNYDECLTTD